MATPIGPMAVRRSIWIKASPERVWQEFTSFERMKAWYGLRHELVKYEPGVGGWVESDAGGTPEGEGSSESLRFAGKIIVFDEGRELTFESDWLGRGWAGPALITFRLTPHDGGTLVELFHHGFEATGPDAAELQRGFEGGWTTAQLEGLRQLVEG
jgi:uncharacterized protein YndB with AHSA1/START domain